jgi:hypothetical protein
MDTGIVELLGQSYAITELLSRDIDYYKVEAILNQSARFRLPRSFLCADYVFVIHFLPFIQYQSSPFAGQQSSMALSRAVYERGWGEPRGPSLVDEVAATGQYLSVRPEQALTEPFACHPVGTN